jgi:hypothetical protein
VQWFFGIGIDRYREFPQLANAVKDVEDVIALLTAEYGLDAEHTIRLHNEDANEENIIDVFDRLPGMVGENDSLLIYYSGHGHFNPQIEMGFWIPSDARRGKTSRYVRNSTIRDYLKAIKSRHTLLISDACFSGSLFVQGASRSSAALHELESIPSRWAICSGRHDEEVADGKPGGNSPFTASILDVLRTNRNESLNVAKLADRVIEQTRSNYEQLPEGSPLHGVGHKGGQFVFHRAALADQAAAEADTFAKTAAAVAQGAAGMPRAPSQAAGMPTGATKGLPRGPLAAGAGALVVAIVGLVLLLNWGDWFGPKPEPPPPKPKPDQHAGTGTGETVDPSPLPLPADACEAYEKLRGCDIPLAEKICAAYDALARTGAWEPGEESTLLRPQTDRYLYAGQSSQPAMVQFYQNVENAYQGAGGKALRQAEIEEPLSFWRHTDKASFVLSAVVNLWGGDIPDGVSNLWYGEDTPLSIPFAVEGADWARTRDLHAAAFDYYNAVVAEDQQVRLEKLDKAALRMVKQCRD